MWDMKVPIIVNGLIWDDWNTAHLYERHHITREKVESVRQDEPSVARETYKNRLLVVIGPAAPGRILAVVIGPVPEQSGLIYPFSARSASRKERQFFESQLEEMRYG